MVVGDVVTFIVGLSGGVLIFIFLVNLIVNYIRYDNRAVIPCNIMLFAILSIIMYLISNVSVGIAFSFYINCSYKPVCAIPHDIFMAIYFISWDFGNISIYVLYFQRIYYTFNETMLSLSKKCHIILATLIILYLLSSLTVIMHFIIFIIGADNDGHIRFILTVIYVGVSWIFDFIISTIMLSNFITKLRRSIEMRYIRENRLLSVNTSLPSTSIELYTQSNSVKSAPIMKENEAIFNIISKISILSIMLAISTQLVLISEIIYVIIVYIKYINDDNVDKYIRNNEIYFHYIKILDSIMKSLNISLFFVFTNKYYQFICGNCHTKITNYCSKNVEKRIYKHRI